MIYKNIRKILSKLPEKYKFFFRYVYKTIKRKHRFHLKNFYSKTVLRGNLRDLYNNYVELKYGNGTYIDPEVIVDFPEKISIGSNCIIRKGVVLRPEGGEIVIGDNCVINHYCIFNGKGGIDIGDWRIIGPHSGFYAQNQTYSDFTVPITKQENVGKGIYLIGDNWIGGHSVICDDVVLGKGAIVGANSTVLKSVPLASIAAGSPAKVIKKRYAGPWDFQKVERAVLDEMPSEIQEHVIKRGQLLRDLVNETDFILDLACGEGVITSIIAEKNSHIIGCDYSLEAISIAKNKHPMLDFIYSNSTNLRFSDNTFSKVIFSDVAEHLLPIQLMKTLKEIKRVLKKNGVLILATPLTGAGKNTSTYSHIYEYSKDEMMSLLMKIFSKVKLINDNFGVFIAIK